LSSVTAETKPPPVVAASGTDGENERPEPHEEHEEPEDAADERHDGRKARCHEE
jgi:hypothetical protein